MNIKKIVVLLLLLVAIIGIITPASATLSSSLSPITEHKGKTEISFITSSDIGSDKKNWDSAKYVSKRKAELNKVNKIVVTINGYKPITYKKPVKGWKIAKEGYYRDIITIKGTEKTLTGKDYYVKLYDKNNKLIKDKSKGKGKLDFGE